MHKGLAMQSALTALEAESAELDDDDGTVPNRTDDSGAGGSGSGRPPSAKDRREAAKESRNHGELNDASRPSAARKKRNRRSEKESEPAMVCMHPYSTLFRCYVSVMYWYAPHSAHAAHTHAPHAVPLS
jgi:hypothetical protein